jgi:aryl carrier-like protein
VAYLTGAADPATLRAQLRERLPAWMVPAAFVTMERLPLNANGKVDRAALPPPGAASLEAYVAPRTAVEARLAEIWAGVLGCGRIGIRDHFQEVGGHSLVATRVVARIRDVLDGDITVATLAEHPTIEALAPLCSEREPAPRAAVDPESSPDHLLDVMDDLSDEEIDRLLAAHTEAGFPS